MFHGACEAIDKETAVVAFLGIGPWRSVEERAVLSSFKTNREILSNGLQLPSTFSFSGYKQALEMAPILKFFVNSLIVSFASTALNVFILAMAD